MKTRKLGVRGPEVSALGFGCMRLPVTGNRIDRPMASRMLLEAIDSGVNYIDTAFLYHNGESESFIADTITGHLRERVLIADKMPSWLIRKPSDFDRYFNLQRRKLKTDRIEVYLLHGLNARRWKELQSFDVLNWLSRRKESGDINYAGFSFHDNYECFENILDARVWDVCQIQYNFMNTEEQAGRKGLLKAYEQGVGVITMEPLFGGKLVNTPEPVKEVWSGSEHPDWNPAERALRWLWDQKEVGLVLSGMSTLKQVNENIRIASEAETACLSGSEKKLFRKARKAYESLRAVDCSGCGYCSPCPQGVDIPRNFSLYNRAVMYEDSESSRRGYEWMLKSFEIGITEKDNRAVNCISCRECEPRCPQSLKIGSLMPEIAADFSGKKNTAPRFSG